MCGEDFDRRVLDLMRVELGLFDPIVRVPSPADQARPAVEAAVARALDPLAHYVERAPAQYVVSQAHYDAVAEACRTQGLPVAEALSRLSVATAPTSWADPAADVVADLERWWPGWSDLLPRDPAPRPRRRHLRAVD